MPNNLKNITKRSDRKHERSFRTWGNAVAGNCYLCGECDLLECWQSLFGLFRGNCVYAKVAESLKKGASLCPKEGKCSISIFSLQHCFSGCHKRTIVIAAYLTRVSQDAMELHTLQAAP